MILDRSRSHGPTHIVNLAAALIDYVQKSEITSDDKAKRLTLQRFFTALWPGMHCYLGDTHFRVMPFGKDTRTSFYVDMSEQAHPDGRWSKMDSSNQYGVCGGHAGLIIVNKPVTQVLQRYEALNLSVWLFLLADPKGQHFYNLYDQILSRERG